jgi:hypothetical protein
MSLYPKHGARWWSRADHDTVVAFTKRIRPRRVLEFGPGTSTLSLFEGGAERVDACEDDRAWFETWQRRLSGYPVVFHAYQWLDPLSIPGLDGERFDLALIDGPRITERRPAVVRYCLERCAQVLLPLESIGTDLLVRCVLNELEPRCQAVEFKVSGPLAGTFALLTP